MLPILLAAVASSVLTTFSIFRLFLQIEREIDAQMVVFIVNNFLWNMTITAPILIAILISTQINNEVCGLIYFCML